MRITVFGRGNVGGGLADLWERAGHQLTRLGRDGGDVSDADVVLVAVPGGAVAEAFDRLRGVEGKTVIDATNLYNVTAPDGFASNAEFVKSKTNGPTAKSFNINFASVRYVGSAGSEGGHRVAVLVLPPQGRALEPSPEHKAVSTGQRGRSRCAGQLLPCGVEHLRVAS